MKTPVFWIHIYLEEEVMGEKGPNRYKRVEHPFLPRVGDHISVGKDIGLVTQIYHNLSVSDNFPAFTSVEVEISSVVSQATFLIFAANDEDWVDFPHH